MVFSFKEANWSSAVFAVSKQHEPGDVRVVIDLRSPKSRLLPTVLPMAKLESCLQAATNAQRFGCFGVLSGWCIVNLLRRSERSRSRAIGEIRN